MIKDSEYIGSLLSRIKELENTVEAYKKLSDAYDKYIKMLEEVEHRQSKTIMKLDREIELESLLEYEIADYLGEN
jgi:hypothetical protein